MHLHPSKKGRSRTRSIALCKQQAHGQLCTPGADTPAPLGLESSGHGGGGGGVSHSVVSDSLQPHGLQATGLLCPWDSADKNTRVDCHFLLQSSRLRLGKPLQSSEENF